MIPPRRKAVGPDFTLEEAAAARVGDPVAGLDEAGRGPWAGPVVAAAVCLDRAALAPEIRDALDDSKKLSARRRAALFDALTTSAAVAFGLGRAEVAEIDSLNILRASLLAMARACAALPVAPAFALVDGTHLPALPCPAQAVVKGDARALSIAAASILAKVSRDREMAQLARRHPGYGWEKNQGYGTALHREALMRLGPTEAHRRSFRPVAEALHAQISSDRLEESSINN